VKSLAPWLLSAMGLLGTWLTGRKYWWAWLWLFIYNALWALYSIITKQYGFLVASVAYGWLYAHNMVKWLKANRNKG